MAASSSPVSDENAAAAVMQQCAPAAVMIAPTAFGYNEETATDNSFMTKGLYAPGSAASLAAKEHASAAAELAGAGVQTIVLQGAGHPDEAFPNNWLGFMPSSSSPGGCSAVLFPMAVPSRQAEVRDELLQQLQAAPMQVKHIHDLRQHSLAQAGAILEGTGALVLDRRGRVAYCALSKRADGALAQAWAAHYQYKLHTFTAHCRDAQGKDVPVYHTNVVLSVGAHAAVLAAECVRDERQRKQLLSALRDSGRHVVCISEEQVACFAGNVLQLRPPAGGPPVWAMSSAAHSALSQTGQLQELCCPPGLPASAASIAIHAALPTIEALGGGSMRCLLAEAWPAPADGSGTQATAQDDAAS